MYLYDARQLWPLQVHNVTFTLSYKLKQSNTRPPPAPASYIRIILEGLTHYGADPAWIATIAAQPFTPARPRAQWATIPPPPPGAPAQRFSRGQLAACAGRLPAVYAIGRKVVRAAVEDEGHPFASILKGILAGSQVRTRRGQGARGAGEMYVFTTSALAGAGDGRLRSALLAAAAELPPSANAC